MASILIINLLEDNLKKSEKFKGLCKELLRKDIKVICLENDLNVNYLYELWDVESKYLNNLISINISGYENNVPIINDMATSNHGVHVEYPSSILDFIEYIYNYESQFKYYYISYGTCREENSKNIDNYFKNTDIPLYETTIENDLLNKLKQLIKSKEDFKNIKYVKDKIMEFPDYESVLFCDRAGTIEGTSVFGKEAPFNDNIVELKRLLDNDKFLLCGITSGVHNEGFVSDYIYNYVKEYDKNLIIFDQYRMARRMKDEHLYQADDVILGFGDTGKESCLKEFIGFLKEKNKLPNNLYGIGDNPYDDIPYLKLIHDMGGKVGFISPYTSKDKIINALRDYYLSDSVYGMIKKFSSQYAWQSNEQSQRKYLDTIGLVDDNWEWLKESIYDEAHVYLKKIVKVNRD